MARRRAGKETKLKRAAKREKAASDKKQAHRLRGPLEASRPDRPPGWMARIPGRAFLHWGTMRNFIVLLAGNYLRIAALANVTATATLILSRAQKKRKRRLLRAKAARPLADPTPKHVLRREYAWGGVEGWKWGRHKKWKTEYKGANQVAPTYSKLRKPSLVPMWSWVRRGEGSTTGTS